MGVALADDWQYQPADNDTACAMFTKIPPALFK